MYNFVKLLKLFSWLHNGLLVADLGRRYRVQRDGSLVIHDIAIEDKGQVTCEASNGYGSPSRASATLTVECKWTPPSLYLQTDLIYRCVKLELYPSLSQRLLSRKILAAHYRPVETQNCEGVIFFQKFF